MRYPSLNKSFLPITNATSSEPLNYTQITYFNVSLLKCHSITASLRQEKEKKKRKENIYAGARTLVRTKSGSQTTKSVPDRVLRREERRGEDGREETRGDERRREVLPQ